jgi:hypothetical protein
MIAGLRIVEMHAGDVFLSGVILLPDKAHAAC